MLKFTVIAGLNDKETKKQEVTTAEAYNIIIEQLQKNGVEGATFTECRGFFTHHDGAVVFENSIKTELLFITEKQARQIAEDIRTALNQESTVLEIINIDSELIEK